MLERITLWLPTLMLHRPLRVMSLRDVPPLGMGSPKVAPTLTPYDLIGLVELSTADGRLPHLREEVILRRGDAVAWKALRRCFYGCTPVVVEPPKSPTRLPFAPGRVAAVAAPIQPSKAAAVATRSDSRAPARLLPLRAASPSLAPSSRPLAANAG